ncbi:hypothetical protein EDD15DRAFT_2160723 [Pisolithus albus]|nr:hypothetical protein EDD15DRAFT_2160723 [Pisolithus albus]
MVYQPQPTASGTYRVKVFNGNDDTYWKYIPDRDLWVQLAKVDKSDKPSSVQFKVTSSYSTWNISPVAGASDTFTIHPAYDVDVGLVFSTNNPDKYWGYGFVQGQVGSSARWKITTNGQYSKYGSCICCYSPDTIALGSRSRILLMYLTVAIPVRM